MSKEKILTPKVLRKLGYTDKGKCIFKHFENMSYWVNEGVCLFYNTPINKYFQDKYYVGYAEMRGELCCCRF